MFATARSATVRVLVGALFVLDCEEADHFMIADEAGRLHIVSAQADGLELIALKTIDATRSVGELRLASTPAEALADDGGAAARRLIAAGRILLAADSLGAADAMIAQAVAYAGQREQFGRVIGSFQVFPCRSVIMSFDTKVLVRRSMRKS